MKLNYKNIRTILSYLNWKPFEVYCQNVSATNDDYTEIKESGQ